MWWMQVCWKQLSVLQTAMLCWAYKILGRERIKFSKESYHSGNKQVGHLLYWVPGWMQVDTSWYWKTAHYNRMYEEGLNPYDLSTHSSSLIGTERPWLGCCVQPQTLQDRFSPKEESKEPEWWEVQKIKADWTVWVCLSYKKRLRREIQELNCFLCL